MTTIGRRICAPLVLTGLLLGALPPVAAQTSPECFDENAPTPEGYGPTDINAVSGNGGLSVALNQDATVTVLKWPSPSFYDQIKYRTTDRSEPLMGAAVNDGAFLGIAWHGRDGEWDFDWLRNWSSSQRYRDDDGDQIVTRFTRRRIGLTVTVRDVVASDLDVLSRTVTVSRTRRSSIRRVRVISFANFNPVVSKTPQSPTDDWCTEEDNDIGGTWAADARAVVHERTGTDESTGDSSGVALAMGFLGNEQAHQVGIDTYAGGTGEATSAYDDAEDGRLSGNDEAPGQADAALADQLSLKRRRARTTVFIAAGFTRREALGALDVAREDGPGPITRRKNKWWASWLESAPLPRNAPAVVTRVAKRSLVSIRQAIDAQHSMIVASIATQPPYGVDWIRDGAYINHALDAARRHGTVAAHNKRYAELQATATDKPDGQPATPSGNWAQNYYADGVAGGPIPYSIDETGFGIWTLWDHYAQEPDRDYLFEGRVYEAIQRAAHYLKDDPPFGCVDPTTNLQCVANEGDNENPSQTLVGAQAVWLGLDAAVSAAEVRGPPAETNENEWRARRDELGAAIETNFFNEECNCFTEDPQIGATLLWPVRFLRYGSERADAQADINWRHMTAALAGEIDRGRYETKILLGNAFAWASRAGKVDQVREGLEWVARVPTTGTGLLGEAWMEFPADSGRIVTMVAQPHATTHALFYLAALKAYGSRPYRF